MNSDEGKDDSDISLSSTKLNEKKDAHQKETTDVKDTIEVKNLEDEDIELKVIDSEDKNVVESKSLLDQTDQIETAIDEPTETDLLNSNGETAGNQAANEEIRSSRILTYISESPLGFLKGKRKMVITFLVIVALYLVGFLASLCIQRLEYDEVIK